MSRSVRGLCVVAMIGALSTADGALGAEPANLVGTWKGKAQAVHIGSNPYRVAAKNGPNFPDEAIEFTYTITEQHGNRFAGSMSNGKFTETIIGAISLTNQSGVMIDDDGQYEFTVRDADTLDICYHHSFPTSRVVACWELKRLAG